MQKEKRGFLILNFSQEISPWTHLVFLRLLCAELQFSLSVGSGLTLGSALRNPSWWCWGSNCSVGDHTGVNCSQCKCLPPVSSPHTHIPRYAVWPSRILSTVMLMTGFSSVKSSLETGCLTPMGNCLAPQRSPSGTQWACTSHCGRYGRPHSLDSVQPPLKMLLMLLLEQQTLGCW